MELKSTKEVIQPPIEPDRPLEYVYSGDRISAMMHRILGQVTETNIHSRDRADENTGHLHPQRGQPKDGGQKLTSKHKQDADDSRDRFFRTHDLLTFLLI